MWRSTRCALLTMETQRSVETLSEVTIVPTTELVFSPADLAHGQKSSARVAEETARCSERDHR